MKQIILLVILSTIPLHSHISHAMHREIESEKLLIKCVYQKDTGKIMAWTISKIGNTIMREKTIVFKDLSTNRYTKHAYLGEAGSNYFGIEIQRPIKKIVSQLKNAIQKFEKKNNNKEEDEKEEDEKENFCRPRKKIKRPA